MSKLKGILVVDDTDDGRELIAELLQFEGYRTMVAKSGREAMSHMAELLPDLVLTDLMMPGMSGAELARSMQESEELRGIPVIVLTATVSEHRERLLDGVKVAAVLERPVSADELIACIEKVLAETPKPPAASPCD